MREIKFRAWNETRKEYCYSSSWDHLSAFFSQFEQVCLFEQFTGLHDKNGKEIYEGDICRVVRWKDTEDESRITGAVFEEKAAFHIQNGYAICSTDYLGQIKADIIEVLGNIHENPELLNAH